ncbi:MULTISPECIES: hypothetical protein [Clostridium]|uniref:hypothetical protein n=1 Tax=Clostridium TaxID=1485 RepID=UPI000DE80A28|nr:MULTISPECIES: hypothetical protein [Clostridium]AXB84604.1 hypothetical protein DRB99_06380 [Clostridium butyricum]MDU4587053.1 hypothetical protein [Clostridium sp.]
MKKRYKVLYVFWIIFAILLFSFSIYIRVKNIDVTEFRLLITYWKQYVFLFSGMIIPYLILAIKKKL